MDRGKHSRQQGLIVLHVSVHHRDHRRMRGQHSLDNRPGQSAPTDSLQDTHMGSFLCQLPHEIRGAVGGIVIDENDFPADALEYILQAGHKLAYVGFFLVGRYNDGELEVAHAGK